MPLPPKNEILARPFCNIKDSRFYPAVSAVDDGEIKTNGRQRGKSIGLWFGSAISRWRYVRKRLRRSKSPVRDWRERNGIYLINKFRRNENEILFFSSAKAKFQNINKQMQRDTLFSVRRSIESWNFTPPPPISVPAIKCFKRWLSCIQ